MRGLGMVLGLLTPAACLTPPPPAPVVKPVAVVPDDPKSCLDIEPLRGLAEDPSAPAVLADRGDRIALAGAAPETAAACFSKVHPSDLPAELIRKVVRAQYGRFRACYEAGLSRNPSLRGSITTRFVIAADGKVSSAVVGGNDLPDCQVVRCVRDAFLMIEFPPPESGNFVTVQYPIMLEPG